MSKSAHDTLGRRHRNQPLSTDKRITPQPRDLLWFQKLHEHGPLSSTYLHAFSQHLAKNEKRSRDRLTDLFNESRTPHGGSYLIRPGQQFETLDARYQELVHDLARPAELALKEHGLWHEYGASPGGPWKHRYMVAAITASIELATFDDPDLTYIPQHAILSRARSTLRYPVPFTDPITGKMHRIDLIPDALFGLEYREKGISSYRFFMVEADRGTEPSRASRFNRKSHLRSFLQYREYVGRGLYKDHLGLTAPLLILNVTTSEAKMERMQGVALDLSPGGSSYQLFKCAPGPYTNLTSAVLGSDILRVPWSRPQAPSLLIATP